MLVGGRVVCLLHIIYAVHIAFAVGVHYVVHVVCVVAEVVPMSVMVIISIVTMHILRVKVLFLFCVACSFLFRTPLCNKDAKIYGVFDSWPRPPGACAS